jgi:hypothetical protein
MEAPQAYQRFAFENQSPQRQRELVEQQQRQQVQRRWLEEQVAAKRKAREEDVAPGRRSQPPHGPPPFFQPDPQGFVAADGPPVLVPQILLLEQRRPLLPERQRVVGDPPVPRLAFMPASIRDAFAGVRRQILAGRTAVGERPYANESARRYRPTFADPLF